MADPMTEEEWTAYASRLVLSAHENGRRQGLQQAAEMLARELWRQRPLHEVIKALLDSSNPPPAHPPGCY